MFEVVCSDMQRFVCLEKEGEERERDRERAREREEREERERESERADQGRSAGLCLEFVCMRVRLHKHVCEHFIRNMFLHIHTHKVAGNIPAGTIWLILETSALFTIVAGSAATSPQVAVASALLTNSPPTNLNCLNCMLEKKSLGLIV
jgi:hypothetical protein